jgi:hypothetical protein
MSAQRAFTSHAPAIALSALAGLIAALQPLHEMDLAQHLANGEWIVRNRAVPFTEPFAWTRSGEPYFAYSWLAQAAYYLILRFAGPLGLHLLVGLLTAAAVAAAYWAARQFAWSRAAATAAALLHLCVLWGVGTTIRPQQFLYVAIPVCWGICARIAARGGSMPSLIGLFAAAALAANTHIFFLMTAVPAAFFIIAGGQTRHGLAATAAVVLGWLATPYALHWPDIFALNFGANVLLARPPSVMEFMPGVEYAVRRPGVMITVVVLVMVPWLPALEPQSVRTRVARALFWATGLFLFAFAGRLVLAWWTLSFPLVGAACEKAAQVGGLLREPRLLNVARVPLVLIIVLLTMPPLSPAFWLFEGNTTQRMLPRAGEDPALWLPGWLTCNTREGAAGRIYTEFNYGSELTWRLPGYSPSIDGRTIFPDSIARDFAFYPMGRARRFSTTWTGADLALLDRSFWLAPVLDASPDWILLAEGRRTSRGTAGALWAKTEWWRKWGTTANLPVADLFPGDARGTCDRTGVFPRLHGAG